MSLTELAKNKTITCPLCRYKTKGNPDELENNVLIRKLSRFVAMVRFLKVYK